MGSRGKLKTYMLITIAIMCSRAAARYGHAWTKRGVASGGGALVDSMGKECNALFSQLKQFSEQIIEIST